MLEDETIPCPVCSNNLNVKVVKGGKKDTYLVPVDCQNCKTSSGKLERKLNSSGKQWVKTEKSYFKLDPRG